MEELNNLTSIENFNSRERTISWSSCSESSHCYFAPKSGPHTLCKWRGNDRREVIEGHLIQLAEEMSDKGSVNGWRVALAVE